ncbi:MAG: alpha/beta hydrolase [Thiotrichales bacterium]
MSRLVSRRIRLTLLALILSLPYGLALGWMWVSQESFLFFPTRLPPEHRFDLASVEEVMLPVDGAVLSALHLRNDAPRGVVFFLHGNAGSLDNWFTGVDFYRGLEWDLFMLDYRGYGKSTGRIESEDQLHADVRAAWLHLAPQYPSVPIVLYGRSLGTGLATRLAREVEAELLMLVSPYTSLRELAGEYFPWIPTRLLRYPMPTENWLPEVRMPVFVVHGEADEIIPLEHAERLVGLRPDAELLRLPGVGHNDVHLSMTYRDAFAARLKALGAACEAGD